MHVDDTRFNTAMAATNCPYVLAVKSCVLLEQSRVPCTQSVSIYNHICVAMHRGINDSCEVCMATGLLHPVKLKIQNIPQSILGCHLRF